MGHIAASIGDDDTAGYYYYHCTQCSSSSGSGSGSGSHGIRPTTTTTTVSNGSSFFQKPTSSSSGGGGSDVTVLAQENLRLCSSRLSLGGHRLCSLFNDQSRHDAIIGTFWEKWRERGRRDEEGEVGGGEEEEEEKDGSFLYWSGRVAPYHFFPL